MRGTQHPASWQKIQDLERPVVIEQDEIEVEHVKPHFLRALENLDDVPEGQHIRLEAEFEPRKDDTLKVEWLRNGQSVPIGERCELCHRASYSVKYSARYFSIANSLY